MRNAMTTALFATTFMVGCMNPHSPEMRDMLENGDTAVLDDADADTDTDTDTDTDADADSDTDADIPMGTYTADLEICFDSDVEAADMLVKWRSDIRSGERYFDSADYVMSGTLPGRCVNLGEYEVDYHDALWVDGFVDIANDGLGMLFYLPPETRIPHGEVYFGTWSCDVVSFSISEGSDADRKNTTVECAY